MQTPWNWIGEITSARCGGVTVVGRRAFAFGAEVLFAVIVLLLICFSGSHLRRRSLFFLFLLLLSRRRAYLLFSTLGLSFDSLQQTTRELTSIFGRTFPNLDTCTSEV